MGTDFLLGTDGDIGCVNGDIPTGNSFSQEVATILMTTKGDFKETPLMGPNLKRRMKGKRDILGLRRDVAISMEMDGKTLDTLTMDASQNIKIEVR